MLLLLACGSPLDPPNDQPIDDTGAPDTAPADTDTDTDTDPIDPDDDEDFLFGDDILAFALTLDAAAMASLDADPKTDVHATFTFGAEAYDVGLHLKGSSGSFRDLTEKAAFKIDFQEWDEEQRFHDLKRLTLNNMVQDASMSSEHAAYYLYDQLGLVAPRHGYAEITVNGELFGLYGVVETLDIEFIERRFEGDEGGNLYEGGYGADIKHGRDDNFELKVDGEPTDRSDIIALIDATDVSTADDHLDILDAQFSGADTLLDLWAAELVTANDDAYSTLANNFLIYHAPLAARWTMIPWGPDQAFRTRYDGTEVSVNEEYYGELALRCQTSPACAARLNERILHVLDVWESSDLAGFVDLETARIEDACRADPRSPWGDYGCRDALAAMRAWVRARPDVVRDQLVGG
ncbi:MAG: CotH kinase family protein [Pseudomonadota bacterium]|nr:CotH kinase family protein [Pseudomonadota bacterium]